jgi:hypothetical protein
MWKPGTVVAFLLVVIAAQSALAAPAKHGTIRATGLNPLTVAGASFAHAIRLRVSASSGMAGQTRAVTTTATGTFIATFNMKIDPCLGGTTVVVRRAGRAAPLAQLKLPARECPPAP